jgi:hypothetical protein
MLDVNFLFKRLLTTPIFGVKGEGIAGSRAIAICRGVGVVAQ